ncbi:MULTISPECIES: AI-2E family transporter [unclassified Emticicia]|uniref:AI-2E family transporter n=1 Tax=unclassified Emticicia TaxID=2627301 RepID=UPI000C776644|nr:MULTISPECIES: AI-2E family transporter [unclassified Emticicia]PLK42196.1 AI-2E family transporter [Emticicia sp. TH156]UTA68330.1 AI-2E family transporter [Emticicia sp. 21SJ11W-3]
MPPQRLPFNLKLPLALLSITIIVYWLSVLEAVLVPFIISIILSILLFPVCDWLEKRKVNRVLAITITLVLFVVLIAAIVYLASTQVRGFSKMIPQLISKVELAYKNLLSWTSKKFDLSMETQVDQLNNYTDQIINQGGAVVGTALSTTSNMIGNMSIMPVYMFFLLLYRDFFKEFFFKVFKSTNKDRVNEILVKIYDVIHSYLSGVIIVTIIVGTLNTISLLLLGIEGAIFFGFLAAILLIIPYIGILIGSLLPIVVALVTKDSPMYAVGVAASFFAVQMLEGNFITPNIVGSKISINPLAAILGLLMGASLWGIAGMALCLPIIAIIKVVFDSVPDLQPYGFLMGEPASSATRMEEKRNRANKIEKEIVETISETTDGVKALFKKKGNNQKKNK